MVRNAVANTNRKSNKLFLKIAITMGVTIGISKFIFIYNRAVSQTVTVGTVGALTLLVQQCVIVVLLMCSKKVLRLCKERFCTTGASS